MLIKATQIKLSAVCVHTHSTEQTEKKNMKIGGRLEGGKGLRGSGRG